MQSYKEETRAGTGNKMSSLQIYVKYHKNVSCQKKLSEPLNSFCESLSGKEGADAMCLGSSKAFITDILLKYLKHMTHAC